MTQVSTETSAFDKKYLNVEGMTCGACSAMIQKLLTSLDGVESCSVSLMLKRAEVMINSNIVNLDDIIEEIEDIGFNASVLEISNTNKNNFTIQLFYGNINDGNDKQTVIDTLIGIEGISNIEIVSDPTVYNQSYIDMNAYNKSLAFECTLSIAYDPNITGMRTITEWINNNENYNCQIIFDASDISQRKKNIQQSREREMVQWTRLFKYSLLFAVPTILFTMLFPFFSGFTNVFNTEFIHGCSIHDAILFLLSTPIQFGPPGILFYCGAFKSLRAGSANMDVLVALATTISYFFSIIQIIICMIEQETSPNTTFETSAILITVIIFGKYLETIAKGKTSLALDKLMDLAPSNAKLVENWNQKSTDDSEHRILKIREIDARLIELNDILEVPRGSKCPCDGFIISGASSMDESLITGESMAVHRSVGDEVIGATVNLTNTIYIKVNKIRNETVLSKIITLVENAQSSRAPIQNLADAIASKFVPVVICISFVVFLGWFLAFEIGGIKLDSLLSDDGHGNGKHSSLYCSLVFGISVLVVSCPCALGLATPTAVMVGTGKAAELGVLFKGGEPLEMAGQTNVVLFDKTGTLTQGKMQIVSVLKVSDRTIFKILRLDKDKNEFKQARDMFWNYIYGTESQSEHLIASAVCQFIEGTMDKSKRRSETTDVDIDMDTTMEEEEQKYEYSLSENFKTLREVNLGHNFECKYWSPKEFIPHSGMGVTAVYNKDTKVLIGNLKYMYKYNVKFKKFAKSLTDEQDDEDYEDYDSKYDELGGDSDSKYINIIKHKVMDLEMSGNTCIFVAINGVLCGVLSITDKIKSDAAYVINYLQKQLNIACYMITGDNEITANAIGKKIGIPLDNIRANVSPANKQNIVKQLQNTRNVDIIDAIKNNIVTKKKQIVTFVGDGINDSPSLAQSDVGIAIGAGTDVAIASASVVLINSKLIDVLKTIDISKATVKRIRLNFAWALVYNVCMIPFAAGILYPIIHYALPPFMAGLLMCLSSISVVCNSLLLKLYKPPEGIRNYQNNGNKNKITDSLVNGNRTFTKNGYYDHSLS